MKKLLIAAAIVCAAVTAQASYFAEVFVPKYDKDPEVCNENAEWYSVYCLTQEAAQEAMGTTDKVTYETYAAWLGKNFEANKQETIDNAQEVSYNSFNVRQYIFVCFDGDMPQLSGALGVAFFENDDGDLAYIVLESEDGAWGFHCDNDYYGSSGWKAVPEPTSAMLMLLGFAGLALKRRRA